MSDIEAIARIAEAPGVPLLVDNTLATPYLCKPIDYGATLIVHSTTKFLSGTGTSMGGAIVELRASSTGRAAESSPASPAPSPPITASISTRRSATWPTPSTAMPSACATSAPRQAPFNAWLTMLGIETLGLRMERHCANAPGRGSISRSIRPWPG